MRSFLLSLLIFVSLAGISFLIGFFYLIEPGPKGKLNYLYNSGRLLFYRYSIINELSEKEKRLLYESTCTRKCHSRDVIEKTPRTAKEWELIIGKMKDIMYNAGFRVITESETRAVTQYLQKNYLSNTPTLLPDKMMRFLKKYLWKVDFGRGDIYLDVIYIPVENRSILSYIGGVNKLPDKTDNTLFFIFISTHTLTLPPWKLEELATLKLSGGDKIKPEKWEIVYEDGQHHHREGILTFPQLQDLKGYKGTVEVSIKLPNESRERVFVWNLPVPPLKVLER